MAAVGEEDEWEDVEELEVMQPTMENTETGEKDNKEKKGLGMVIGKKALTKKPKGVGYSTGVG